jgi:ADP-heptose:LPS heptosyltransferase
MSTGSFAANDGGKGGAVDLTQRDDIRRILVIRWSAMGDVLIATTVLEDIRRAFPGREIHLNTMPAWEGLFRGDPRFERVFAVDLRGEERGWSGTRRWLRLVRQARYDLIIDLQSSDHTRLLLAAALLTGGAARHRVGRFRQLPYNHGPGALPEPVAAVERMRAAVRAIGVPTETPRPVLHVPEESRRHAAELAAQNDLTPGRYALFMPGSQAAGWLKRWGAERYAALALHLRDAGVEKVVLIGGPDEVEECERIQALTGPWVVFPRLAIPTIVPLAEGACCSIANDTGTAHVAAAAPTPMVVVCGPTDPRVVKPVGDNVHALQADIYCKSCYRKTCTHHSCMALISPERVRDELAAMGALPA